ncbi:MAG: peptidase M14, partial [bacterium]|nr:peptidase M14 [bacterium]
MIRKALCFVFIFVLLISQGYSQKSPDEFFGLTIGADRTLVKYPEIIDYFKYIAAESDRIQLVEEGKSTLGNPMYVAVISSAENIKALPGLIEINKRLTNADTIGEPEAGELVKDAKVFILITCTIHSMEIASSQYAMLLAHQLATTTDPAFKEYLDNVVILLMPSINPDGNIMVTDWYKKHLGTDYEGSRIPYLYHHYAGHDNNRDFFMLNLKETRVVNAVLHQRYYPQIFLDMHQMGTRGPRMFVPPFKDPLNVNLKPLMLWEVDIIGTFMALKLQEKGKKGVGHSYAFDAWWPGGTMNTAWFKNVVGTLTELASADMASPIYIEPNELGAGAKGLPEYKAQVNFPDPWPGGWWRMKDIIEYETIAVEAMIEVSSKNRKSFVTNSYKMSLEDIEKGKTEPPFGYIIPVEQWDLPASYTFLKKMQEHGIRISRLDEDARIGNTIYKKGGMVIPMSQPYREFIKVVMERQIYPDIKFMAGGEAIIEPYDVSGWTMPLQMGVEAMAINSPLKGMKLTPVANVTYPQDPIQGEGNYYLIPAAFNRSAIVVNRLLKKGVGVSRYTYSGE